MNCRNSWAHRHATAILAAHRDGKSPAETMRETYAAIRAWDDPALFIALRDEDEAVAAAAALDPADAARKPLFGAPFAVKDNIDVAGLPTTAACPAFAYAPTANAFVVQRLIDAGAIPVGKTNLDQFATGLVGVRSPYGTPRNARDAALIPGGSSSGSASAVAAGLVPFALGTDTAGSGRVPAALQGITGLKPSLGAISTSGVVPACRTLDCVSIFAATAAEARAVFDVAQGFDAADPYARRLVFDAPGLSWDRLKLGVPSRATRRFLGDDAAEAAFDATLARLTTLGAAPCFDDVPPQALRRTRRRSSGRRIMRWLVYHASGGNEVGGVDPEGKGAAVPSALAAVGQRRESECARSWQHDTLSGSR